MPVRASTPATPLGGKSNRPISELTEIVSRVAAQTFEVQEVPADTPFVDLGADSLLALRFRARLGRALNRPLPATLAYDYPTVAAIVRALAPFEVDGPGQLARLDVLAAESATENESNDLSKMIREIGEDSLLDLAERMLGQQ
jgi:acyl carrier protein